MPDAWKGPLTAVAFMVVIAGLLLMAWLDTTGRLRSDGHGSSLPWRSYYSYWPSRR
jgi:hypothetical protein